MLFSFTGPTFDAKGSNSTRPTKAKSRLTALTFEGNSIEDLFRPDDAKGSNLTKTSAAKLRLRAPTFEEYSSIEDLFRPDVQRLSKPALDFLLTKIDPSPVIA